MNILLVNPTQGAIYGKFGAISQPHMGLAYIAAVLERDGHKVSLIDMDFEGMSFETVVAYIQKHDIQLLGITATTPIAQNAIRLSQVVKKACPNVLIVAGGIHATIIPHHFAAEDTIDYVVRGEGEATIAELVNTLQAQGDTSNIHGLSFKRDGKIVDNPDRPLIKDLDSLPFPARHLFSKKQYEYPDTLHYPAYSIITSRGCPGRCTFCQSKNIYGNRPRFRSAKSVVDEVEMLIKDYGAREIHVWDDNFAANKNRVFEIRDEIKRRNIKTAFAFSDGIRVDNATDVRVLEAMREMGGYSIAFGIESGSPAILKDVFKGITLDQARHAVKAAKKVGFEVWCFFMMGFPNDSEETLAQTVAFAKELDPHVAKFHILKPYPGSLIFEEMKRDHLIDDLNYENYGIHTAPVHHTRHLSPEQIIAIQQKAYKSFYLRPKVILMQILRLRSYDRIKNNLSAAWGVLKLIFTK